MKHPIEEAVSVGNSKVPVSYERRSDEKRDWRLTSLTFPPNFTSHPVPSAKG